MRSVFDCRSGSSNGVLSLELGGRMNSVDNERRNELVALNRSSTCVSAVLPLWFLVCIGAAEVVLSIEGPLAILI